MTNDTLDWVRLQKALMIEAQKGFCDLMGKHYRFSEFISLTFGKFPTGVPNQERQRWQRLAADYTKYPQMEVSRRQHLVAQTRQYLQDLQLSLENGNQNQVSHHRNYSELSTRENNIRENIRENIPQQNTQVSSEQVSFSAKIPKTKSPIASEISTRLAPRLDQKLQDVSEIGKIRSRKLESLGLYTIRDLLYYYPRDHIDYARQVSIQDLLAGETVTIIATVKRCSCFSSPKNKKLTILELVLRDRTGELKIGRFFAGARFASRGWQESMKRRYVKGSTLAACGLVKDGKYGKTLENPELEVLAEPGDGIESLTIGRVVPIYGLTEGLVANTLRHAVRVALGATVHLKDPLP
ncbi:MAG: DNA helicase RecG, partial [Cyanobacteria bacterium P01_A01_bin.80]